MYYIKPNELEAIALASSSEQTRYYLCGVNIEINHDDTIALIATDGHRLATIRANLAHPVKSNFIISTSDIDKILGMTKSEAKALGKRSGNEVLIRLDKTDTALTFAVIVRDKEGLDTVTGSFTSKPIDGNFPDYRRVIPAVPDAPVDSAVAFNSALMVDFDKMAKLLLDQKTRQLKLENTGKENPMLITMPYCQDFLGVLMPMRF